MELSPVVVVVVVVVDGGRRSNCSQCSHSVRRDLSAFERARLRGQDRRWTLIDASDWRDECCAPLMRWRASSIPVAAVSGLECRGSRCSHWNCEPESDLSLPTLATGAKGFFMACAGRAPRPSEPDHRGRRAATTELCSGISRSCNELEPNSPKRSQ